MSAAERSEAQGDSVVSGNKTGAGRVLRNWTIASFVAGGVGALIGLPFGAPSYFGFFVGFVMTGLSGLFAVAAHLDNHLSKRR